MSTIGWPTNKALDITIRKMMYDPAKFIGARFAPIVDRMSHVVEYDEVHGPQGMTRPHSLDGDVSIVKYPQVVRKTFAPGYFKEKHRITESDLLRLRALGATEYQAAQAQQIIGEGLTNLNVRIENRVEWLRWQALLNGKIHVNEKGIVINADYGLTAAQLNRGVAVSWTTGPTTATGIVDLVTFANRFVGTGYTLKFLIMNSVTAALFTKLTDTKTYYQGMSIKEKLTPGVISQYGPLFLPGTEWIIYDGGYETETTDGTRGTFTKFIADNKIVGLGDAEPGEICDFVTVPSLHSPSGMPTPGKFAFIIDETGIRSDNPKVEIVAGMYGLPRIRRPEPIQVMDVSKVVA